MIYSRPENYFVIAYLIWAIACSSAHGQCFIGPDGQRYCYPQQPQQGGGDYRIGDKIPGQYISQPNQRRSPQGRYVAPLEPQRPWQDTRVVKLRNGLGKDSQGHETFDWGSGAVVTLSGESKYVLTCAHVTGGLQDEVLVVFSDGKENAVAACVQHDGIADWALLQLPAVRSEGFDVAAREPQVGEMVYAAGFPHAKGVRIRQARVAECGQLTFEVQGASISGDSGGPICNEQQQIVGVIHSTTGYSAVCCRLGRIRRGLDGFFPNRPGIIIPRADQPECVRPPVAPLYPVQPKPPQQQPLYPNQPVEIVPLEPQQPQAPPYVPPPYSEQPPNGPDRPEPDIDYDAWEDSRQDINQQQAQIQQQLQTLLVKVENAQGVPGPPGPAGQTGLRGEVGPPGPAGGASKPFYIRVRNPKTGRTTPFAKVDPNENPDPNSFKKITIDLTPVLQPPQ